MDFTKKIGGFFKELGLIKGIIIEKVIGQILGKVYEVDPACGYLEFVAILDNYRRQRSMTYLINWTFEQSEYLYFMFDRASNNKNDSITIKKTLVVFYMV